SNVLPATGGTATGACPLLTTTVTFDSGAISVPAAGSTDATLLAGKSSQNWSWGSPPDPAPRRAAVAWAQVWAAAAGAPGGGGRTGGGPDDTTTETASPPVNDPASGSWLITVPAGSGACCSLATVNVRSAPDAAVLALSSVSPTRPGTSIDEPPIREMNTA